MTNIKNECSQCWTPYVLNTERLTLTAKVPSNGVRGKGHVPAHEVTAEVTYLHDGTLIGWECPVCGYAESEYASAKMRKVWA